MPIVDDIAPYPAPWWSSHDAAYWHVVEDVLVALDMGSCDGVRRRVRSAVGRELLVRCRDTWPSDLTDDPLVFAKHLRANL